MLMVGRDFESEWGLPAVGETVKMWWRDEQRRRVYLGQGVLLAWIHPVTVVDDREGNSGEFVELLNRFERLPVAKLIKPKGDGVVPVGIIVPDCPRCGGVLDIGRYVGAISCTGSRCGAMFKRADLDTASMKWKEHWPQMSARRAAALIEAG